MEAGKLDQKIQLQSLTETNNSGEVTKAWTNVAMVPAYIVSQHGSESIQAAQTTAVQTIRVAIRYRNDVDPTWRFSWDGDNYNIVFVDRSQRRKGELWMTATMVDA